MKIRRAARCQTPISVTWMLNLTSGQRRQATNGTPESRNAHCKNQDVHAYDDDLDMPDFAAMIADFKGPKKGMIGYKDLPTIGVDSKKELYPCCKVNIPG